MQPPEHLTQRILAFLQDKAPQSFDLLGDELKIHIQMLLRETFSKLELVSREEFEVQQKVLARTRSKVDALEQQLAALEISLAQSKTSLNQNDSELRTD